MDMQGCVLHLFNGNIPALFREGLRNTQKNMGLYDWHLEGESNQRFSRIK